MKLCHDPQSDPNQASETILEYSFSLTLPNTLTKFKLFSLLANSRIHQILPIETDSKFFS